MGNAIYVPLYFLGIALHGNIIFISRPSGFEAIGAQDSLFQPCPIGVTHRLYFRLHMYVCMSDRELLHTVKYTASCRTPLNLTCIARAYGQAHGY